MRSIIVAFLAFAVAAQAQWPGVLGFGSGPAESDPVISHFPNLATTAAVMLVPPVRSSARRQTINQIMLSHIDYIIDIVVYAKFVTDERLTEVTVKAPLLAGRARS
jgi:hypothetical protein